MCRVLYVLFGRDTRAAQVVNVFASALWGLALIIHLYAGVEVELPHHVVDHHYAIFLFVSMTMAFGVAGLLTVQRAHQIFKSFGLILGALLQAVLANGYVTEYPPLDMLIVVCAGLSVWFLLAVFYIFQCEGIDG